MALQHFHQDSDKVFIFMGLFQIKKHHYFLRVENWTQFSILFTSSVSTIISGPQRDSVILTY